MSEMFIPGVQVTDFEFRIKTKCQIDFRLPRADPRPGVPQEREERLCGPAPRLHLPHGRDGRLRVLGQELAPGHTGAPLSKAIWQLSRLIFFF